MRKKSKKTLGLKKETIARLSNGEIRHVNGGGVTSIIGNTCKKTYCKACCVKFE